jgi:TorA maturation chaperone TorD
MTAERDRDRSHAYRLLGMLFWAPRHGDWVRDQVGEGLAEVLARLYPDSGAAASAAALGDALREVEALALEVDHAALFVGPFRLEAPPYGSVHLEEGRTLMGDSTVAAARCYAEAGLATIAHEPPDHIGIELEFMAYLAARSATARAAGDERQAEQLARAQRRFLGEHLGAWAPRFCDAMRHGARTCFYRALAECLGHVIDAEARYEAPR